MAPPPESSNEEAPRVTMSSPGRVTIGTPAQRTSAALVCALYLPQPMRKFQSVGHQPMRKFHAVGDAHAQRSIQHQAASAKVFDVLVIVFELGLKQKPVLVYSKNFSLSLKIEGC
jgi:hypothetical protein